jgi:hypothetical protein
MLKKIIISILALSFLFSGTNSGTKSLAIDFSKNINKEFINVDFVQSQQFSKNSTDANGSEKSYKEFEDQELGYHESSNIIIPVASHLKQYGPVTRISEIFLPILTPPPSRLS